jgi:hypothetical protein
MLPRRSLPFCGVLILALALVARPASAQVPNCDDQAAPRTNTATAFIKLVALEGLGCLGGDSDKSALAGEVAGALKPAVAANAPNPLAEALKLLHTRAELLSKNGTDLIFSELAVQLVLTRNLLGTNQAPAKPTSWDFGAGTLSVLPTSLETTVSTACAKASAECVAAFDRAREVLRIARLTRHILNLSFAEVFGVHLGATTMRLKQWGAYFDSARSQYPWELLINGKAMGDDRKVIEGVKQGFRSVPNYQWIAVHPTIAFEYDKTQPKGEQMNPVAVVDIFGVNKWTWKTDGTMGTAYGATIIASIGDKAAGNNISWGLMGHLNHKYSVGFTRNNDKWTVILSGDFPKVWAKVPQSIRDRIAGGGQ